MSADGDEQVEPSTVMQPESNELGNIYRRHSPTLVNRLTRETGCRELARELAHEAFAKLSRMSPAGLAQIQNPEAYLRRMSGNLLRDWYRHKAVADRSAPALQSDQNELVDQVAVLESRDTLRRLEAAIAKLKPRTREVFVAHRLDGLSYAEIAEQTGLSIKGVEKQMAKAIAKIDRLLDRR